MIEVQACLDCLLTGYDYGIKGVSCVISHGQRVSVSDSITCAIDDSFLGLL